MTTPTLKHVYDSKMRVSADQAIWHADLRMETLIRHIFEFAKPEYFVETGTHMGWTSHWIASRYPEVTVHTVELSEDYYRLSGENLAALPNVKRTRADSRGWLRALLPLPGVTLLWIDSHFNADHPLLEECRIVDRLDRFVCIIDDYHCGSDFPGDPASPAMVEPVLGDNYWRPAYPYKTGMSGYALFVRGIEYTPPTTMRRAWSSP